MAALSEGSYELGGEARPGLDGILEDMVHGLRRNGYHSLQLNGSSVCYLSALPKDATPPAVWQALVLLRPRSELLSGLQDDSSDDMDIERLVVGAAAPTVSLKQLMLRLALPMDKLDRLQRVVQRLVHRRQARVVEVYQEHTRVALAPDAAVGLDSEVARSFKTLRERLASSEPGIAIEGGAGNPSFPGVVALFGCGQPLKAIRGQLDAFDRILEWAVAENMLVQLGSFYHFLPSMAKMSSADVKGHEALAGVENMKGRFCPTSLTEDELYLLGSRADAESENEFLFLCRFAIEFARAHVRSDGCRFQALAEDCFDQDSKMPSDFCRHILRPPNYGVLTPWEKAESVLEKNRDIFVRYVCPCR